MSQAEVRQEWELRVAAYRSSGQSATNVSVKSCTPRKASKLMRR